MFPSTKEEEEWCLDMWLDWRRSQGLDELVKLDSPPSGPDRRYRDSHGRLLGVEITRVLDPGEREQERFAAKFLEREVIPRVEDRLPGKVFAWVERPLCVRQRRRREFAEMVADRVVVVSRSLAVGESASCSIALDDASVRLRLLRGSGGERVLRLGDTSSSGKWTGEEWYVDAVVAAIRMKAARGQLASGEFDWRVLLLHDRMPGISAQALEQAVDQLKGEAALRAFDQIYLVDTYRPGRCLRAWPLSS